MKSLFPGLFGGLFSLLGIAIAGTGCSGRNLHSELHEDPRVLVRQFTRQTDLDTLKGERSFDFSNPIFFENTLIFGSRTQGLTSLYHSLNLVRWKFEIPGGVVSPLLLEKGNVFFTGGDGFLYSVSAETGKVNWRYELRVPTTSRPTVAQNRVFVLTADDSVYCLDAGTGKWLWHYRRRSAAGTTIHGAASPLVDQNEVIVGLTDGFLVGLNLQDGQLKWEKRLNFGTKFTDLDATPVLSDGLLYVPAYDGSLYALKRAGAEVLWKFDGGGSHEVSIEGDRLFFPSSDGAVFALQKETGKVLWKFELDRGTPTQLILTDRYVVVGSSFQYLYVIDKATGEGLYRYNVGFGSGFYGAPAFDRIHQNLYILSSAGNLYQFLVRKPARKTYRFGAVDPYVFFD